MAEKKSLTAKGKDFVSDLKTYWRTPIPGRYMSFREIAAYSGGGIGAYMIVTLGIACLLATGNTLISSTLGVDPTDMYILYVIAVLANIPFTGIRAHIIDNTRNKAGKYRPYIVTMAIPTAIICILMVWFPYDIFNVWFAGKTLFGEEAGYVAKCTLILIFNLALHFFYYFFYDGYENLIHVLSPDSQERADVSSIKSVVYSLAPSIVNLLTPIIAKNLFHTNTTDIRVYRFLYPILGILGILLCIVVYKYTEEKIIQARSHIISVSFFDAIRAVAKNKYFWIISMAGWIGFLESAYANILFWLYNYGGACNGNVYGLIVTLYGNSSLWGMILAPFAVRRWGKKAVLVFTNVLNVVFILLMLPFTHEIGSATIWLVLICMYLNGFAGSFMHILNPSIQADIRDYQQYKTGERIDGMFSAVATIGTVITLLTSSILPMIYEKGGINKANAIAVTHNPAVLDRVLGDGKSVGTLLAEQLANGQDNYTNSFSALYDPDVLLPLLHVLIIVSAVGAFLNVVPYFWYDFNEKKQKSVVRVLQVRAMFEDYGNNVQNDAELVKAIDVIHESVEMSEKQPKSPNRHDYENKKEYRKAKKYNEEIEIAKFVCDELNKYSKPSTQQKVAYSHSIFDAGLEGLRTITAESAKAELVEAKALPHKDHEQRETRDFYINNAHNKIRAVKIINEHFADKPLVAPDYSILEKMYEQEDALDEQIKQLYLDKDAAKKVKDKAAVKGLEEKIKELNKQKDALGNEIKAEMDIHVKFSKAAKPYLDAEKLLKEEENYKHFDEIEAKYEEAKANAKAAREAKIEEEKRLDAEKKERTAALKAEKERLKNEKKNSKKK